MKKWIKILLFSILGILLILFGIIGYIYYQYEWKYDVNSEKHQYDVGYLSSENSDFASNFKRCNDYSPIGYYSHVDFNVFDKNKAQFKRFIQSNFNSNLYTDSGMLNLRFIINCNGEVGDMEVNQLNKDYQITKFNNNLVEEIIQLTVEKENWVISDNKSDNDKYMYLIFRLEDGKITEILP